MQGPDFGLSPFASGSEARPDSYPELYTLSGAFLFRFLPVVTEEMPLTEYVRVPLHAFEEESSDEPGRLSLSLARVGQCGRWNMAWEAGSLRQAFFFNNCHVVCTGSRATQTGIFVWCPPITPALMRRLPPYTIYFQPEFSRTKDYRF